MQNRKSIAPKKTKSILKTNKSKVISGQNFRENNRLKCFEAIMIDLPFDLPPPITAIKSMNDFFGLYFKYNIYPGDFDQNKQIF